MGTVEGRNERMNARASETAVWGSSCGSEQISAALWGSTKLPIGDGRRRWLDVKTIHQLALIEHFSFALSWLLTHRPGVLWENVGFTSCRKREWCVITGAVDGSCHFSLRGFSPTVLATHCGAEFHQLLRYPSRRLSVLLNTANACCLKERVTFCWQLNCSRKFLKWMVGGKAQAASRRDTSALPLALEPNAYLMVF